MRNKYARIFALLTQISAQGVSLTYEEAVHDFTGGRTKSLKDLSDKEIKLLEGCLQSRVSNPEGNKLDATRKAIIAQFRSIGRTAEDAKSWAEKYGVNGVKKPFNKYTGSELWLLLQNAKKVQSDFIKSINKRT